MSRGVFFLFLFCATYLRADLLISFYSCDSGIVDCSSFPAHYYGDFGLSGHPPINVYMPSDAYQVTVTESNIHGQVIGYISSVYLPGNGAIFGANGAAVMLPDQGDEFNAPVDINNNGVFLFNVLNGGRLSEAYISFGSAGMQPLRNYLDEPALLGQLGA